MSVMTRIEQIKYEQPPIAAFLLGTKQWDEMFSSAYENRCYEANLGTPALSDTPDAIAYIRVADADFFAAVREFATL